MLEFLTQHQFWTALLLALIALSTAARDAWLVYRGAVATDIPSDPHFQQLTKNVADLTNAIRNLKQKGVKQ